MASTHLAFLATPSPSQRVSQTDSNSLRREDADPPIPPELARALSAFGLHDAAGRRHLDLMGRLRGARHENEELRSTLARWRDHNVSAAGEMRRLREAVEVYTQTLKSSGLPPERALVMIRKTVSGIVAKLPAYERPVNVSELSADLVQCAIRAYFAA